MALTDFGALTTEKLTLWQREVWKVARKNSYIERFLANSEEAVFQRQTELRKDRKGARCVITLVPDVGGNGIVGDNQLSGNEQAMVAYDQVIELDQLRNGVKSRGRMTEMRSVVDFRKTARNSLGVWLANVRDEMAFLTLSGIPYNQTITGAPRPVMGTGEDDWTSLAFAASVTPPSTNRAFYLGSGGSINAGTGYNAPDGTLRSMTYADIVNLKAIAKERGIKPSRHKGMELYHLFLSPSGLAKLKLDPDFIANLRNAGVRGKSNELFAGTSDSFLVDGMMIHETFYVFTTRGAAAGSKFGVSGNDDGQRALLCGAQALAVGDIGLPEWSESDITDYGNQPGIAVGKIMGFLKPRFKGSWDDPNNPQDFGVITIDTAL